MDLFIRSSWWILSLVLTLSQLRLCVQEELNLPIPYDDLPKLGRKVYAVDPCELECECYSWESVDEAGGDQSRFTVNCSGLNFGRLEGSDIPVFLPYNTTDLFVSAYRLGMIDIRSFPNMGTPFPSKTYSLTPKLLTISLNGCRIVHLTSRAFYGSSVRSYVKRIDLGHNYIELVPGRLFWQFPSLQNISIPYNFIRKVEQEAFKELPKTLAINLSNNDLEEIHPESFVDIPHLEILDLSHNSLTSLPWEITSQLPSLKYLGLDGNYWNCSCEMTSIFNVNHSLIAGTEAKCRYPAALKGTPLKLLTRVHFHHCQAFVSVANSSYHVDKIFVACVVIYIIRKLLSSSGYKIIRQIEFDPKIKLGNKVYKGKLKDGRPAAIKVCSPISNENLKELNVFLSLSEKGSPHPNIVQYMCTEKDWMATYLALELCGGNLKTAVIDCHEEFRLYLKPENCLSQLACGLSYLHEHGIQHRDIKPSNILWKKSEGNIRFIISDFDLGHLSEDQSSHKAMYGSLGWTAPELWNLGERTSAVDVFSLGCVFYFVLTIGGHPFGSMGDMESCQKNITSENYQFTLNDLQVHWMQFPQIGHLADDLVSEMIHKIPQERPEASDIMDHPLLWDEAKVVSFFHKIGDCMEDKTDAKIIAFKEMLESKATVVFEGSWMDKLDKVVKSDIDGFKKQQWQLCGILRVIRNKEQHFGKLKNCELRKIYFDSKEGVVQYYSGCFPRLLVYTYRTLIKSGLRFKNGCIQ